MDPRFRRNHQLHLLLKKRTHVSDHELYEMMRSKQVYRAQNELRRELERTLQEINLDQKVRVASFMVQKATFIKMMAARERGRRRLLNVSKLVGRELMETMFLELNDEDQVCEQHCFEVSNDIDNDIVNSSDLIQSLPESQDTYLIQSANTEWMEDVSKGAGPKEKTKQKGKPHDSTKKRMVRERQRTEYSLKDTVDKALPTQPMSSDEQVLKQTWKQQKEMDKKHKPETREALKIIVNDDHLNDEIRAIAAGEISNEAILPEDISAALPEIKSKNNQCPRKEGRTLSQSPNPSSLSQQRLLGHLPPISNTTQSKTLLSVPSQASDPKDPEPQERERSVSMLFVEDSEDNEDYIVTRVSPFDIEAFNKYYKRPRGYSIIISSTAFPRNEETNQREDTEIRKKRSKKNKISANYSHHPHSWGVKTVDEINPRHRSNQWYQNFLKSKKSKKIHEKTTKQRSRDLKNQNDHDQHQTRDEMPLLKLPSSMDSRVSQEMLCQLKLQRLKQHCQSLSQRVALFVSSQ